MSTNPMTESKEETETRGNIAPCTGFQDIALSGKLAVGAQYCDLPVTYPAVYVNGDVQVDGAIRTDATLTAKQVAFLVGRNPSAATLAANGEAQGQLGVVGALRVARTLGVGTAPLDDLSGSAQLVVRGQGSDRVGLQVWQSADATNLAGIDRRGRLGVGTDAPTASLEVAGRYLEPLSGTLTGSGKLAGHHRHQNQVCSRATRRGPHSDPLAGAQHNPVHSHLPG